MKNRVVITGMGVVSPNGIGLKNFTHALRNGISGISFYPELRDLGFSCQLGAVPEIDESHKTKYLSPLQLRNFNSSGILYAVLAGMEAVEDAGLDFTGRSEPAWDLGVIFGAGTGSVEKFRDSIYQIDGKKVRRLGSTAVLQTMVSGPSAYLAGLLGAGNQVTANSSACATGAEALLLGYERIRSGRANFMLCGSTSDPGPYIWGGFDALRVTNYKHNDSPQAVAGPMNAQASGFIPGSGAGACLLESLESARRRGAPVYAEILGGHINNGGQIGEGSMTAPNSSAIRRCIRKAVENAGIHPGTIDCINGHLTATSKDPDEIKNWSTALNLRGKDFPWINSLKGMIGHGLAASASMEIVASVLQLSEGFIFPNTNSRPVHAEILEVVDPEKIPDSAIDIPVQTCIKASFGFGDVNACIIFKKI